MKKMMKYVGLLLIVLSSFSLMAQKQTETKIWVENVSVVNEDPVQDIKPANPSGNEFTKDKPSSDIKESIKVKEIKTYPNPSNGHFNVEIPKGVEKLSICASNGATIFEMDIEGWEEIIPIDISRFDDGVYFLFMSAAEVLASHRICVIK